MTSSFTFMYFLVMHYLKILWFNSPFYNNLKISFGKMLIKLLKIISPETIFNKYIIKISSSSSRNKASTILAQNRQILCPVDENYGCNCRVKTDCPIQNRCLTPQVVYEAEVKNSSDKELKAYYSLTKTTCKERHRNYLVNVRPV